MKKQEKLGMWEDPRRSASEITGREGERTACSEHQPRACLMCGDSFDSEGAHNRICRRCKASQTYRGA